VLGIRRDGQKVLLAVRNGAESAVGGEPGRPRSLASLTVYT